ncbi:SCF ubiquitin ligase complex subunit cdc4 [Scheffersomyces spartinae]|uniref:SCF ubiquitin ligase complex subunit cdc4 n=1 Tax=Scheffersomyces spartinae TaxID=45513 RepID=A0A9P8AI84_9ASCO|nr:SCF ubiquitin ligase complex subunit cdc4 [Scheffersomyces spartinae]KAG7194128.1 SCF ubiquitin ligase complex subunit cdc4 [Scheffersomyces spartinae]
MRLSDSWLPREYQKLTLLPTELRENRKRIRNVSNELNDDDGTAISDFETQTSVHSDQKDVLSLIHPPKRRLTSVMSPIVNEVEDEDTPMVGVDVNVRQMDLTPGNEERTTTINASTAVSDKSPSSNTPDSIPEYEDNDNQPQQLPLPSPSASPVQTGPSKAGYDPMENLLINSPQTQGELLDLISNLSVHLNERNQNYLIFKLLQNVNRRTLSMITDILYGSLKRDLISGLPPEITVRILSHMDYKTLGAMSQVCKSWNNIVNNKKLWIDLLVRDKLITPECIEKEINDPKLLEDWNFFPKYSNIGQVLYRKRRTILRRWMDPTYEPKRISVPGQGKNLVTCLQQDEEKIVTGVDDKLINIYCPKTGKLLKVLKGHDGGVWALKYTGNTLISGSTDRTVRIWNTKTGKCTHVFRGHTSTVRCLDILHPVKIGVDENGEDIIFPKQPLLVTGSRDSNLHVWKLPLVSEDEDDDDMDIPTIDSNELSNQHLVGILLGHTQSVRTVCGYGNIIVSGSYDTTVRVWDLMDGPTGSCKFVFTGHSDRIYTTVLDYSKKICYSGSMDSKISVWSIETGKLIRVLEGHCSLVGLLELSDNYLVSGAADATLRVWNPETGEGIYQFEGHSGAITCFQHDSLRTVSGSEKMLKLWDMETGEFVRDLLHDATVGIWQVRFDFNRCVAAVQRTQDETFIEILDFSEPPKKPIEETKKVIEEIY